MMGDAGSGAWAFISIAALRREANLYPCSDYTDSGRRSRSSEGIAASLPERSSSCEYKNTAHRSCPKGDGMVQLTQAVFRFAIIQIMISSNSYLSDHVIE